MSQLTDEDVRETTNDVELSCMSPTLAVVSRGCSPEGRVVALTFNFQSWMYSEHCCRFNTGAVTWKAMKMISEEYHLSVSMKGGECMILPTTVVPYRPSLTFGEFGPSKRLVVMELEGTATSSIQTRLLAFCELEEIMIAFCTFAPATDASGT